MGRRGIELEVKFAPAGEATLADLAERDDFPGWRVVERRDEGQRNTYYDTPGGALEANRCSLRRRILDDAVEWTFKRGPGPGRDGVSRRREINALLPRHATDLPKCEPVRRAQKVAGREPLQPLFTLLTARRQVDLLTDDGRTRVALALDRVRLDDARGHLPYEETEIEIELLDGDEGPLARLALWLMATCGLLPSRGSKRGRAQAWLRGEGLPVVAPALGLRLIEERVAALAAELHGRPPVVKLAAPRGSPQARLLATALAARFPAARLISGQPVAPEPSALSATPGAGPVIVEGPDALESGHDDLGVWVAPSLGRQLLARLLADARAGGLDEWEILRRCGEYVLPMQRRYLDPTARWADLVVIDNAPPPDTPSEQVKVFGWPAPDALARVGAVPCPVERQDDRFFRPPAGEDGDGRDSPGDLLRVRLCGDTAWVSFAATGEAGEADGAVATCEARPRVLTLLRGLGYRPAGQLATERRRHRLGGWELALDHVAGLGYFCELRRFGPDERDAAAVLAALGLSGARTTTESYLALWAEAQTALAPPDDLAVNPPTRPIPT